MRHAASMLHIRLPKSGNLFFLPIYLGLYNIYISYLLLNA